MLNLSIVKTKLAPDGRRKLFVAGLIAVALSSLALPTLLYQPPTGRLVLPQATYALEFSVSEQARARGLSGRKNLARDRGMLFVFDEANQACMWMKDMHFSIDIVWLNKTKRVEHIAPNVSPNTYPRTFCSSSPATYVIELPAGTVVKNAIQPGQVLSF
jgi:uncharacterized membrane protein (UPF0127 family)